MPRTRTPVALRRRALVLVAAVLLALGLPQLPRADAARSVLPLTVTNNSGRSGVHVYLLGVDLASNRLGYVDASGTFHAWSLPGPGGGPVAAPDIAIPGPADGASTTLRIPTGISGRVYFSYGSKLSFDLVSGGLVQPAPWNPADPNATILFDWSEFTYSSSGLWINSSQVDQFAAPHLVSATGSDGVTHSTGATVPGGRQKIIDTLRATPGYARTVITGSDGSVLRVLGPGKATEMGLLSKTYLDPAIDRAWRTYATTTLTVAPFGEGLATYRGRTEGDRLVFTDISGRRVASFAKPSTEDVWDCDGALAAPNDQTVGPIARTLCAALHRGNLATQQIQPGGRSAVATFYASEPANLYSKVIHAHMADGKAYGFAFDDVLEQESLVHSPSPTRAEMVLEAVGASGTGSSAPTEPPAPSASATAPPTTDPVVIGPGAGTTVTLTGRHPGYATLVLGEGTEPGIVTVTVEGGTTSSAAVSGPSTTRIDLAGPPGTRRVTITSTGALGPVAVQLP